MADDHKRAMDHATELERVRQLVRTLLPFGGSECFVKRGDAYVVDVDYVVAEILQRRVKDIKFRNECIQGNKVLAARNEALERVAEAAGDVIEWRDEHHIEQLRAVLDAAGERT